MPPSNDNIADAQVIIGPSGELNWDNLGSTAESGEISTNGHTVWFKWTVPVGFPSRFVMFNTLPLGDNLKMPLLRTELRLFSIDFPTVEVAYTLDQRKHYGGTSPGSYLIVWLDQENGGVRAAENGLYIRVDGVSEMAANTREGFFQLRWGPSDNIPILGKCGTCLNDVGLKTVCIDKFEGPTDLMHGDYRHMPWVFNGKSVVTKKYQRGNYAAGKYLLRYCSGYYIAADVLTVYQSIDFFPASVDVGSMWVFHSDVMAGNLPSRPDTRGATGVPITRPGDFNPYSTASFGSFTETWAMACDYVDATGTLQNSFNGSVTQLLDSGGNPVGNPTGTQSASANPFTLDLGQFFYPLASNTRGAVSDDPRWPSYWHTQPELQRALMCDGHLFRHTGGEILFVYALLRFSGASSNDPEIFDGDLTDKLKFSPNNWHIGPAGPPAWTLMRIMPDIILVEAICINEFNATANGPKDQRIRVRVRNNSVVSWENTTVTPSGFFVDQDATYSPSPPMTVTVPADDVQDYNFDFVMTDPVGDLTLALSDTDGNPMPSLSIHITPLFTVVALTTAHYNGTSPKYATKPVTKIILTVANIGNGAPLSCQMTATPDSGQIAGGSPGHMTAGFQDNLSVPIVLNPGQFTTSIEIDLEQLSTGARTVKVTFDFSDTGNDFPPTILTVAVPGL